MKRSTIIALAVQTAVLFALPGVTWLVGVTSAYLILSVLILMVAHPLCCLVMGTFAGVDIKTRWWLLLTGPVLALCGDLMFFAMEAGFLFYAGINFLVGILGLAASALIKRLSQRYR